MRRQAWCVSAKQVCVLINRGVSRCSVEGVYRSEVECENVAPAVLTIVEGSRLLGHGEHPISARTRRCVTFHHRPSVSRST